MSQMISITVTGPDRPGIIAGLTGAIFKAGGNLEDASMTILEGEFAMIVIACLQKGSRQRLQNDLTRLGRSKKLTVAVKEIKGRLVRGEKHKLGTEPYIISVYGKDRAGIVYRVSQLLADQGFNITDLNSRIIGTGPRSAYALILEVDLPKKPSVVARLNRAFEILAKKLGVTIALKRLETVRL